MTITQEQIDEFVKKHDYIKCTKRFGNAIIQRSSCEKRAKLKIINAKSPWGFSYTEQQGDSSPYDPMCYNCTYWKEAESI